MLKLLFDTSFWWDVILIIAVVGIIVAIIKYPNSKYFIYPIMLICLVGSALYSLFNINAYYTARGGIHGVITGIFNPNEVQTNVTDYLQFDFKNIMLTETSVKDEYQARFINDKVVQLSSDEFYGVYVNGMPCDAIENGTDYIIATYEYNFYDSTKTKVMTDTLTFKFAFYTKQCLLTITTNGGAGAVKYWNNYFNKNTFIVTVEDIDNPYQSTELFANYSTVTFVINEQNYAKQVIKNGSTPREIVVTDNNEYRFNYWTLNGEQVDPATIKITADTTFVANVTAKQLTSIYIPQRYTNGPVNSSYYNIDWTIYSEEYMPIDITGNDIKQQLPLYDTEIGMIAYPHKFRFAPIVSESEYTWEDFNLTDGVFKYVPEDETEDKKCQIFVSYYDSVLFTLHNSDQIIQKYVPYPYWYQLPIIEKENFLGWSTTPDGAELITPDEDNCVNVGEYPTLYAIYSDTKCAVTFHDMDTTTSSSEIWKGKSIGALPTNSKYGFLGWTDNRDTQELIDDAFKISADVDLYAVYSKEGHQRMVSSYIVQFLDDEYYLLESYLQDPEYWDSCIGIQDTYSVVRVKEFELYLYQEDTSNYGPYLNIVLDVVSNKTNEPHTIQYCGGVYYDDQLELEDDASKIYYFNEYYDKAGTQQFTIEGFLNAFNNLTEFVLSYKDDFCIDAFDGHDLTKVYTLEFKVQGTIVKTSGSTWRYGVYSAPIPNVEGYTFNYWMVDGQRVDIDTYEITKNTVFEANLTPIA